MAFVYLGIGTNLGEKEQNLQSAILKINTEIGDVRQVSSFYSSVPWGFVSANDFLNAVLLVDTLLTPDELLCELKLIEKKMGRTSKTTRKYTDRIIDIDILLYENRIVAAPGLNIPHAQMAQRDFVLIPLAEIAPDLVHPTLKKTILDLRNEFIHETHS